MNYWMMVIGVIVSVVSLLFSVLSFISGKPEWGIGLFMIMVVGLLMIVYYLD